MAASLGFALLAVGFRVNHDRAAKKWDRLTKTWEPAILEVLGGAAEPEGLYGRVGPEEGPDFLTFLMTYVRRLRGDEQALVRKMAAPYLHTLLPRVAEVTDEVRGNAVMMLARMGMPAYAEAVAKALDDESPVVSMIAAGSLFRPEHEQHFPDVLVHLPRYATWSRSFLAGMLAGGGYAAAPLLRGILLDTTQSPRVRAVAADALRALNDLDAVGVALHIVKDETDRDVLAGCLRILRQLGHAEHAPVVRKLAASLDPVVRARAVAALGTIGGHDEIPILFEKLDDPSFWVSLEAARGLLGLGERATVERLAASEGPWSTLARQVLAE